MTDRVVDAVRSVGRACSIHGNVMNEGVGMLDFVGVSPYRLNPVALGSDGGAYLRSMEVKPRP